MPDIERQSGMDPAEGSRESVGERDQQTEREQPQFSHGGTGHPPEPRGNDGGGISNRPLSEEGANQDAVPPRGLSKDEDAR